MRQKQNGKAKSKGGQKKKPLGACFPTFISKPHKFLAFEVLIFPINLHYQKSPKITGISFVSIRTFNQTLLMRMEWP